MVIFGYIWLKFGRKVASNSLTSMLGTLHDVIHEENNNHDGGATVGYLKEPQKGPKYQK